ncbi:MAG: hypothetical protein GF411_13635 [Candidatus Lokiarchaeota archaeon]|nr:hypothetical protein [Candidatus Lokiarchaeota archaeon]
MPEEIKTMTYEFFSWRGFFVGALLIVISMVVQSLISFPQIWLERTFSFTFLVAFSAMTIGTASGGVLVYLFPPDQDVIGVAGLGSDDATQHMALFLILVSLVQPLMSGFIFFFDYYSADEFIFIWVITDFLAPSAGFTASLLHRTNTIAQDLKSYFSENTRLKLSELEWLHGVGPRTAAYRMGMLENAIRRVKDVHLRGHEVVFEKDPFPIG